MHDFTRQLGKIVRKSRLKLGYTQKQTAELVGIDDRTVLNIEKCIGNPKMEVLYPLVRALKIDANELFYPELQRDSPSLKQLRLLIEDCSESEAAALLPAVNAILNILHGKDVIK